MLSVDFVGAAKFNIQHSTFNTLETWWVQLNSTFNIPHSTLPILTLQLDFSFKGECCRPCHVDMIISLAIFYL